MHCCDIARRFTSHALRIRTIFLLCLTVFLQGTEASVHYYSHEGFRSSGNGFLFYGGSEGMRASTSKGTIGGVANGRSYIRFDSVTFRRPVEAASKHPADASSTGVIQAVVFDVSDRDKVGSGDLICCTPDVMGQEGCKQGEVIVHPSSQDPTWPFVFSTHFKGNSLDATLPSETVNITKTGLYNLYVVVCDPQLKGVFVDGATVWKNPTGYLPGSMTPLMTFYGYLCLAYILLGLIWISQSIRYWKDMVSLQSHLTVIIALGMLEVTLWYFEYANFNATGHRPIGITLWAVTFGSLKKALCRVLLLAVSMGYGVVRPTVGAHSYKLIILGATYFLAVEILDIVENVGAINELSGNTKIRLVLPVAVLDAVFILWIFISLSKILEKLQAKRLVTKLDIYRKLTNTLSICVVIGVAWIGYEFYFKATDPYSERWEKAWTISAFWSILTFTLLCIVCVFWAPSENTSRYAYLDEEERDKFDEDLVPLSSSDVLLDVENADKKLLGPPIFTMDDDCEENKRE